MRHTIATEQTHPQIKQGLLHLAERCDYASSKDGEGFNKVDSEFGKSLAEQCDRGLSQSQQCSALKMLRKYKRQLATAGIELPTTEQLFKKLEVLSVKTLRNGWEVKNESKGTCYKVTLQQGFWECECPLHQKQDVECKHIREVQNQTIDSVLSATALYIDGEGVDTQGDELEDFDTPEEPEKPESKNHIIPSGVEDAVLPTVVRGGKLPPSTHLGEASPGNTAWGRFPPQTRVFHLLAGVSLNKQQENAIAAMWDFYHAEPVPGKPSFFLLEGFAGVGKTYTIQQLVKLLQSGAKRPRIVMCAPTNKATQVLERMASKSDLHNIDFATIFQLLALKLTVDDDGKEKVEADPHKTISLDSYDLVILDESSMVSRDLWKLIGGTCRSGEPKVIFMGDPAQLPPIGEVESKVFEISQGTQLTQVMRFGSVIGKLVTEVRDRIYEPTSVAPYSITAEDTDEQVLVLDKHEWLERLVEDFKSDAYKSNPDHCRALAWTNRVVQWVNTYVRESIHGLNAPQFLQGERLIALKPVLAESVLSKSGKEIVMTTSSECEVFEVKETDYAGYKVFQMWVTSDSGRRIKVNCLAEDSRPLWLEKLEALKQKAFEYERGSSASKQKWREYFGLRDQFAPLTYCYAVTTHKAQGSTFSNVYVALSDIMRNNKIPERNQLVYTAFSRAAKGLFIVK